MEQHYRYLKAGETIRTGDQYQNPNTGDWFRTYAQNERVQEHHELRKCYRRPLSPPQPEPEKCLSVITPGEYRTQSGHAATVISEVDGWAVGCIRYKNGRPPVGCTWHRETGAYWHGLGTECDLAERLEEGGSP